MAVPTRRSFVHNGAEVYQWEQSLEDVIVYITPPPGVRAAAIACKLTPGHVRLGLRGSPPFLDEDLAGVIVAAESTWMLDDGELTLTLTKARKAETWPSVFVGHGELDTAAATDARRQMLLERFQAEHPGFDFSGAEVTGDVPDPRSFLGGVK